MNQNKQPEALRLASSLRHESEKTSSGVKYSTAKNSAKELERQHAELERLRAEVKGLRKEREPLSEVEIAVACGWRKGYSPLPKELHIARAIEAAHGITALQSSKEQP